jgi:transcription elongation factor Elf1
MQSRGKMVSQCRPGIRCSHCDGKTKVVQTLQLHRATQRWRKCTSCGHRFQTIEVNSTHLPTTPALDFPYKRTSAR